MEVMFWFKFNHLLHDLGAYLLAVHGPISQNGIFFIQMMHCHSHHSRNLGFKFQVNQLNRLETWRDYVYMYYNCIPGFVSIDTLKIVTRLECLWCKINYTCSHIWSNIFQTVHFSTVKFTRGNEINMSFLLISRSQEVWNEFEAIKSCSFNQGYVQMHTYIQKAIIIRCMQNIGQAKSNKNNVRVKRFQCLLFRDVWS